MDAATTGPAAPPERPQLTSARRRVAQALDAVGPDATLKQIADLLGGHPNTTRAHLDALTADGLAARGASAPHGRGRPTLTWSLTDLGRRALGSDPTVAAYAELVTAMASHLAATGADAATAREIGRAWGASRVPMPERAATKTTLGELGFDPEPTDEGLRLHTCPLLDAASAHPGVVCGIHAGMIQAMSGDPDAELLPFAEPGACVVRWGQQGVD